MQTRIKTIKLKDVEQGTLNSCVLLAIAPDNLLYQEKPNGRVSFQFHDRLTGAGEWVTVRGGFSSPRDSSYTMERAYGKWLKREGIVDELGQTGLAAVSNGNRVEDVARDVTGRDARAYDPNEAIFSSQSTVLLSGANTKYFAQSHAYKVLGVSDGNALVFNPWVRDGREIVGADDGFLAVPQNVFASDFVGWGYSF